MRRIATQLYSATPNGEPGNDDLGAMSSWYVWAAIGMYPETPGRADLVLSTPMFPSITIRRATGQTIDITAPGAPADRYVTSLTATGFDVPAASVHVRTRARGFPRALSRSGTRLHFTLGSAPNRAWGAAPAAAPPSLTPVRAAAGS